jgi:hypothetical protein
MRIAYWCKELLWRDKLKHIITQLGAEPVRVLNPMEIPTDIKADIVLLALADLHALTKGSVPVIPTTIPLFGFFPHVEEHLQEFGAQLGCRAVSTRGAIERNLSLLMVELSCLNK